MWCWRRPEADIQEVNAAVLAALGPEAPATFDEAAARYGAAFKSVEDEWAALVASSTGSGILTHQRHCPIPHGRPSARS
jgi:hypothetical protein